MVSRTWTSAAMAAGAAGRQAMVRVAGRVNLGGRWLYQTTDARNEAERYSGSEPAVEAQQYISGLRTPCEASASSR